MLWPFGPCEAVRHCCQIAVVPQTAEDCGRRLLGAAGRHVDDKIGIARRFIGIRETGERGEQSLTSLGVESLSVSCLADLQGRGDVHKQEAAAAFHQGPYFPPGSVVGRDRGADGDPAVLGDFRSHKSDPADVAVTILLRVTEPKREVLAYQIAIEERDPPTTELEQLDDQDVGDRRLARAGKSGKEDNKSLAGPRWVLTVQLLGHLCRGEPRRQQMPLTEESALLRPREVQCVGAGGYRIIRCIPRIQQRRPSLCTAPYGLRARLHVVAGAPGLHSGDRRAGPSDRCPARRGRARRSGDWPRGS